MQRDAFSYLVSNPTELSGPDVAYLEGVAEQYPFCGLAYTLLAKGYAANGNPAARANLPRAAAYALSRNALRKLLSGEFPPTRPAPKSLAELLEARASGKPVPVETTQPEVGKESIILTEPREEFPLAAEIRSVLPGFGLDYSDVLQSEEASTGTVVAEEKPAELVVQLQQEQLSLIDRFIDAEKRLGPLRATPAQPGEEPEDLTQKRASFDSGLVTESFAQILVRQGKLDQAIGVYEKLGLKNPAKKAYFAQKIEELKGQLS